MADLPCGVIRFEADGTLRTANRYFLRMLGFDDEEAFFSACGGKVFNLFSAQEKEKLKTEWDKVFSQNTTARFNFSFTRRDGTKGTACGEAAAFEQDRHRMLQCAVLDISDQSGEGFQTQVMEERYRLFNEHRGMITIEYSVADDTVSYASKSGQQSIRKPLHLYLDGSELPYISPEYTLAVREALKDAILTGKDGSLEYRAKYFGRNYAWYRVKYICMTDDAGKVVRIIGQIENIEEEKLRNEEDAFAADMGYAFRKTISSRALLSLKFDLSTGCRNSSPMDIIPDSLSPEITAQEMFELLRNTLVHPEDRELIKDYNDPETIREVLDKDGGKVSFDCRIHSPDVSFNGYRWIGVTYMYFTDRITQHTNLYLYALDIDEKKKQALRLLEEATHDGLTKALNLAAFEGKIHSAISSNASESCVLVLIDIDKFKSVNDLYGHAVGDKILIQFSNALRAFCRPQEFFARTGGDEFLLLLPGVSDDELLQERMRILGLSLQYALNAQRSVTVSIGAVFCEAGTFDLKNAYEHTDTALYQAKQRGGNQYIFYSGEMDFLPREEHPTSVIDSHEPRSPVYIRTFGYFDVFLNGRAVNFRFSKSKELLALLVDRRGGYLSSREAISFLWEDEPVTETLLGRYRQTALRLKSTLKEYGIADIIESTGGNRRIIPDKVDCDYFNYSTGKEPYRHLFKGIYMANYSWGEVTLSSLLNE